MKIKVLNVVGARPNFMKIAPIMHEMQKHSDLEAILIHTGQHYDKNMSQIFSTDLGLPKPDVFLGVGSANHGEQTGKIMMEFEKVLMERNPDLVIVVGDVNSTIACALVAVKLGVRVAHVEAGLRSFDRSMPEEINRLLTDRISDLLFVTEKSGEENLLHEGIDKHKIHFVGNVMVDTLLKHLKQAEKSQILNSLNFQPGNFAVLTLHRPHNVDSKEKFKEILHALTEIQKMIPIVFPIHPRSKARLNEFGLKEKQDKMPNLLIIEPVGYLDFLRLTSSAKFVLTDSGGIQEETTVLGIPCLTLRDNTERPVTVTHGTNLLIGSNPDRIIEESLKIINGEIKRGVQPDLWDGKAAERIVDILRAKNVERRAKT